MPAVSFYLPEETLKALRTEARNRKTSVSRLIRTAVEGQLGLEATRRARSGLVRSLQAADLGSWDDAHRERTEETDDRG